MSHAFLDAVIALTAIGDADQVARRAPLTVVEASSVNNEAQFQTAMGIQKKKKARRATGPLRRWTAEEDQQLLRLVEALGEERPKRAQFDAVAAELQTNRSGYAVEQHWHLYLRPGAPKAARGASDAGSDGSVVQEVRVLSTNALGESGLPSAPACVATL